MKIFAAASLIALAGVYAMPWSAPVGAATAASPMGTASPVSESKTGSLKGTFCSKQRLKTRGATGESDVVVYLRSKKPGAHKAPKDPAVVEQKKLQFSPHVVPVLRGTKVLFKNLDKVDHNVFSSDACCKVDSNAGPGKEVEQVFDKAGVASIVCRLHPDMSVWVIVLEEPWFASVSLKKEKLPSGERTYSGDFEIDGIPPGKYEATFWNKKLDPETFDVEIKAGEATALDITVEGK